MLTLADVLVDQVHTLAPILTGVTVALVQLVLAAVARVARLAVTRVAGDAVHAGAVVARVGLAVVGVALAQCALVPFSTAALVSIGPVVTLGSVLAGRAGALINVDLTHGASKPWLAGACEAIDHVPADSVVHTRVALTLIHIHLTVGPHVAWHADAGELSDAVQTGGIVLAGHGQTLVDVDLTAGAGVASTTLALEGPLRVHTLPKVFTGVGTNGTLVHVLVAGSAHEASGTGADGAPVQGVGVTHGALVTRVADARVVQVTQQTGFPHGAFAEEGRHAVVAGGAVEAHGGGTVVDVLAAVVSRPAVDAHAGVPPDGVEAGASVMAGVGLHKALIDILCTVLTCPLRWALAIIGVDSIHTQAPIHTPMPWAVVHVRLTVVSLEPWQAGTVVGVISGRAAGAPVDALGGGAGQGGHLAGAPAVPRWALAAEGTMGVHAEACVETDARLAALVDIVAAVLPLEPGRAGTVIVVIPTGTAGAIGTGAGGTGVYEGAVLTSEPSLAHTGELWHSVGHLALAGGSVEAWRPVTGVQALAQRPDVPRPTYALRG